MSIPITYLSCYVPRHLPCHSLRLHRSGFLDIESKRTMIQVQHKYVNVCTHVGMVHSPSRNMWMVTQIVRHKYECVYEMGKSGSTFSSSLSHSVSIWSLPTTQFDSILRWVMRWTNLGPVVSTPPAHQRPSKLYKADYEEIHFVNGKFSLWM